MIRSSAELKLSNVNRHRPDAGTDKVTCCLYWRASALALSRSSVCGREKDDARGRRVVSDVDLQLQCAIQTDRQTGRQAGRHTHAHT